MDGKAPFVWLEECNWKPSPLSPLSGLKRKAKPKKMKFFGWGSKPLIKFLESIGKDTSLEISQYGVTDIITNYVRENSLIDPKRRKVINCDERLYSLFGKNTIGRYRIYDMLEAHFPDNHEKSKDDPLFSSEEESNISCVQRKGSSTERQTPLKKQLLETPRSCFAAIVPDNIKLVYLKKSLIEDLLKDPQTFEHKIVGSFVRINPDPSDCLRKTSHQLLQVIGLKKVSGIDDTSKEILLKVSNLIKDIQISALSDDHFSQEECEDLRRRLKDGLLKRPTVAELEKKALILHEDMTKHWLAGELVLLQKLIDRANEKGRRRELFTYLERRQLLQSPDELSRLLSKVPKVIADQLEPEATPWNSQYNSKVMADKVEWEAAPQHSQHNMKQRNHGYLIPIHKGASEIPICNVSANDTSPSLVSSDTKSAETRLDGADQEQKKLPTQIISESNAVMNNVKIKENKIVPGMTNMQVIDLSDDDGNEDQSGRNQNLDDVRCEWYYADTQGETHGPFSLEKLKGLGASGYITPDYKVWKLDHKGNIQGPFKAQLIRITPEQDECYYKVIDRPADDRIVDNQFWCETMQKAKVITKEVKNSLQHEYQKMFETRVDARVQVEAKSKLDEFRAPCLDDEEEEGDHKKKKPKMDRKQVARSVGAVECSQQGTGPTASNSNEGTGVEGVEVNQQITSSLLSTQSSTPPPPLGASSSLDPVSRIVSEVSQLPSQEALKVVQSFFNKGMEGIIKTLVEGQAACSMKAKLEETTSKMYATKAKVYDLEKERDAALTARDQLQKKVEENAKQMAKLREEMEQVKDQHNKVADQLTSAKEDGVAEWRNSDEYTNIFKDYYWGDLTKKIVPLIKAWFQLKKVDKGWPDEVDLDLSWIAIDRIKDAAADINARRKAASVAECQARRARGEQSEEESEEGDNESEVEGNGASDGKDGEELDLHINPHSC